MSPPLVRRATSADLDALGRLGALLVRQHYDFDPRRFLAPTSSTPDHYAAFLGSQLDDPDVVLLVAEDEGQVVGYAYAAFEGYDYQSLRGPSALLHDLLVDPAHRDRGVGRALLEETIKLTTERALIDDNGDGKGREASAEGPDGGIARIAYLDSETVNANGNPELAGLIKRRQTLEQQAEEHKQLKGVMPDAEWNAQFEKLMLELAQVSAEIRKKS